MNNGDVKKFPYWSLETEINNVKLRFIWRKGESECSLFASVRESVIHLTCTVDYKLNFDSELGNEVVLEEVSKDSLLAEVNNLDSAVGLPYLDFVSIFKTVRRFADSVDYIKL